MSVRLSARLKGNVMILDLHGNLAFDEGTNDLRRRLSELTERGFRRVILNLEDIQRADSSGIVELVVAYTKVNAEGGQLRLLHLPYCVKELLMAGRLILASEAYDDEFEALRSFTTRGRQAVAVFARSETRSEFYWG